MKCFWASLINKPWTMFHRCGVSYQRIPGVMSFLHRTSRTGVKSLLDDHLDLANRIRESALMLLIPVLLAL